MRLLRVRIGRVSGRLAGLLFVFVLLSACSTTTVVVATPPPPSDDDDFSNLIAQMRSDLSLHNSRVVTKAPAAPAPAAATKKERDRDRDTQFAARAKAMFEALNGTAQLALHMPVVGVEPFDLTNSWGDARDGGKRKHRGIDIFAPKGTPIVAVADGIITYIGEQPKGGNCLWLTTENGPAFYYAHLDRWAPGLYEGMEVRTGDLLGFVGNTGNAKHTPPHLHFAVNQDDEMVNPYPILTKATVVMRARINAESGASSVAR